MELKSSPKPVHKVIDYDITYTNGYMMSLTVDAEAGDTFAPDPTFPVPAMVFHFSAKPSNTKLETNTVPEDLTVILPNVLCLQKRERDVSDTTPEQRAELQKLFDTMPGPKH